MNFSYLHENKLLTKVPMDTLITYALTKYNYEIVNYLIGLNTGHDLRIALSSVCWRDDDNVKMVQLIFFSNMNTTEKK
ncbi:putative ORFan [Tupanvirus deep ocean]|uniref:ORFan n=2 Tax=Tupanvirus TaxID=2094720 RepID=A0AC62A6V5_9VIRU|nr:putative ORFan [Tupanvirus deep ocean]QKU33497.1 putative ORFan [Tupanvirus deep ocean]